MARGLPRHVLMTADAVGGVWNYALQLAGGLRRQGIRTTLAVMGPPPSPAQRQAARNVPDLTIVPGDFRLEWMRGADDDVRRAGDWLLRLEETHRPDVVQVNGYAHAALPWRAPCVAVAHSCVRSWFEAVKGCGAPREWSAYALRVRRGLSAADLVVAPTAAFLDTMERLYGPLPHGRVIWNGSNPAHYRDGPKKNIVFSAGRLWDAAKNVAALDVVANSLPWPVLVAGGRKGPDGNALQPSNVRLLGLLSSAEMRAWMARASIFALPARYEPFGLSVLEAGMSGCALVLGDIPTLRELWGGAAVFVPPDDTGALRATLRQLTRDKAQAVMLGQAAKRRAACFTLGRMTAGYVAAYAEAMAARRKAPAASPSEGRAAP